MRTPTPLRRLLQDGGFDDLSRLQARCGQLNQLDHHVRKLLPESLRPHCRVANLEAGRLVLLAESPAWHALLRYQLPALQRALEGQRDLPPVHRIQLRVQSPQPAAVGHRDPIVPLRMAAHTATLIAELSQGVADDRLRTALLRLARHGAPGDSLSPPPDAGPPGPQRHPRR